MCQFMESQETQKWANCLMRALQKLYTYDANLLGRNSHEMTISAQIAMYLRDELEEEHDAAENGLANPPTVDVEYHSMINDEGENIRKAVCHNDKTVKIRPDIIYHRRSVPREPQENYFVVEVKLHRTSSYDLEKIQQMMDAPLYYQSGFCIDNIGPRYITITSVNHDKSIGQCVRYKISYNSNGEAKLFPKNDCRIRRGL